MCVCVCVCVCVWCVCVCVERESYGGKQNTSAYCLVYISDALWKQWEESGEGVCVCVCVKVDVRGTYFRTKFLPLPAAQYIH